MAVNDVPSSEAEVATTPSETARRSGPRLSPAQSAIIARLQSLGRRIFNFVLVVAALTIAVALGVQTSRILITHGSPVSTMTYGPWTYWVSAGRADADPYTRAHIMKGGALRLSSDTAGIFEANSDTQGSYLHSSCDYVLEGPYANGQWWSIAVFDSAGALINNDAQRYAFTSDNIAANPDGSYIVTLGRDARPGNWLPTGGAGRLVVVFTLLDPPNGLSDEQRAERYKLLPEIRRENCS